MAAAVPLTAATGWEYFNFAVPILSGLAAVALAERRGLVKTPDEIQRPASLFAEQGRRPDELSGADADTKD